MDAMVTARMSAGLKARGNEILAQKGKTASAFIGEVYEYIVREKRLPDLTPSTRADEDVDERARLYRDLVAGTVLPVPAAFWDKGASDNDLIAQALEEKYGSLA